MFEHPRVPRALVDRVEASFGPVSQIEEITGLRLSISGRGSFRAHLAGRRSVKLRCCWSERQARELERLRRALPDELPLSRILAREGRWLIEEWVEAVPLAEPGTAAAWAGDLLGRIHSAVPPEGVRTSAARHPRGGARRGRIPAHVAGGRRCAGAHHRGAPPSRDRAESPRAAPARDHAQGPLPRERGPATGRYAGLCRPGRDGSRADRRRPCAPLVSLADVRGGARSLPLELRRASRRQLLLRRAPGSIACWSLRAPPGSGSEASLSAPASRSACSVPWSSVTRPARG